METLEGPTCSYVIDDRDVLVSVDDAWLDFARDNSAPELTRSFVTGRSIWDFIAGDQTRELYARLFASVRSADSPRTFPFRCDSPTLHRFMELRLVPAVASAIELRGTLLRERVRVYCPILDRALGTADYSFPACSLCNRIFAFGSWLEADEAVRRLGAFDTDRPPGLEYTVCEVCRRQVEIEAEPAAPA
jgi:hypothetical protein